MKKTKLFVSLIMGITAIFCGYIAKTNAVQLIIPDGFFGTGGITTGNYADIHFQANTNDLYGIFFLGDRKPVEATLNLTDGSTSTIHCDKQLNGYYVSPYTNYQMLGLNADIVNYTRIMNLTQDITFITGGLFYDCTYNGQDISGIYGYIKREYGSSNDVKNIHEIRAGLKGPNGRDYPYWTRQESSPLQQTYSTTTGNNSKTISGYFYSSTARTGTVIPRAIGDMIITNNDQRYEDGVYKISRYNYEDTPGLNLTILSSKPNQTGKIIVDNNGQITTLDITTQPQTNDFGFLGETTVNIQIPNLSSGTITLQYSGNNGNLDRTFSINFEITEDGFSPCLPDRNNDYFITQHFRENNPTENNIKCAIFGHSGNNVLSGDYETAYTKGWTNYDKNCLGTTVASVLSLPSTLNSYTIYVLTGTEEVNIDNLTMPECSAIVSPSKLNIGDSVTLIGGSITFNSESKFNVLDNISVKGGGISFNNSHDNTLNMIKVYNSTNGINLSNSHHILLNNIQSFNNNVGINMISSYQNAINNTQIYRNNMGLYMEESTHNIFYNSAINQNITGLYLTTGADYNTFKEILINNNYEASTKKNRSLFIKNGLNNTGINIILGDNQGGRNYFMEYTGNRSNLDGYQTSMEILGYIWTMKRSPRSVPYEYHCLGGTSGMCYLQAQTGELESIYFIECTGTYHTREKDETERSFRNISANGGAGEDARSFNITSGTQATFIANGVEKEMDGFLIGTTSGFEFAWFSGGKYDYENTYFKGTFNNENNYALIEYKLPETIRTNDDENIGIYNITEIKDESNKEIFYSKIYTGTRYEIFTETNYTGTAPTSITGLNERADNYLCDRDGYLTTGTIHDGSGEYGPYVFYMSGYIFSNSNDTGTWYYAKDDTPFYINHMTNPETSITTDEEQRHFLNDGRTIEPHGKTNITNTIKRYSYGKSIKLQKDILLSSGSTGGLAKNTDFYIGSNIPKPSLDHIPGYNEMPGVTKVHFKLGITGNFTSMQGPVPTNYHVISLRGKDLDNVNTILQYTGGYWTGRNNGTQTRENPTTTGYTGNKYMSILIGSGIDIYVKQGNDISSYPVIYQVYNTNNYYFTHRRTSTIENRRLVFNFGGYSCLPPQTERVSATGYFGNYERDTTGFYAYDVNHSRNIRDGIAGSGFSKIGTGKYWWESSIPCYSGELCNLIMTSYFTNAEDILHFKVDNLNPRTKTYQRDRQGPSIRNNSSSTEECNTHEITLTYIDDCNCVLEYEAYSDDLNFSETGRNNNCNENNFQNHTGHRKIGFSTGQIGRTGHITKSGRTLAWDFYYNNFQRTTENTIIKTGHFYISISNTGVTIKTGTTKSKHLKYTGDGNTHYYMASGYAEITGFITGADDDGVIIINPIELLGAKEGKCGTGDLYVDNVQCFTGNLAFSNIDSRFNFTGEILTGQIIIENGKKTQRVKIFHVNKAYDNVICAFTIKDNEGSGKVGYIGFRINTLHVPLINPEIVSGVKYVNYSGYIDVYGTTWTGDTYTHGENEKYSSGDLIYINLHANDCVAEYYASCDEYYGWTGINEQNSGEYNTGITWNNPPYTGFYLSSCKGDEPDNFTGRQTPIKISVRNGEFTGDNGFFTNTGKTEDIIYDYTSPVTQEHNTGGKEIIAGGETMNLEIRITDKYKINDNGELDTGLLLFTLDTGTCHKSSSNGDFTDIQASFKPSSEHHQRLISITGTVNIRENACEGGQIILHVDTGITSDFAGNPSTNLEYPTKYTYTNKTAIYVDGLVRSNHYEDRRVATKSIERKELTGEISLQIISNLPIYNTGELRCTGFNDSGYFICLNLTETGNQPQVKKQICEERSGTTAPYCTNTKTGDVIFKNRYNVGFTICSGYDEGDPNGERVNSCTGRYSTNDTTGNWLVYGNIKINENPYNEDYVKIQIYRKRSPFKAGKIEEEIFYDGSIKEALKKGSGDNGFVFYISHPQRIKTGSISGGVIGAISYDLNFSTGVADEFYYITGEAIVNGFKQSRSIKRPTYNYENPKSYLFNFPDYGSYNE